LLGCDITYTCIDSLKFEVSLTWYRDCRGIALNNGGQVNIRCNTGGSSRTVTLPFSSISEITPFCPSATQGCSPANTTASGDGIEKHVYKGILDFNTAPLNTFASCSDKVIIGASINARNGAITTGPSGTLYNDVEIDLQKAPCNSSPTFTNDAIGILCCNQPFFYNLGASDTADLDSLSYSFTPPRRGYATTTAYSGSFSYNNPITAYYPGTLTYPYNNPGANPPIGIYLDPVTGDFIVTPTNCSEVTVVAIQITEWRNDTNGIAQIVGKSTRDMQLQVRTCPDNNNPKIDGPFYYSVCEGDQLCFNLTTQDNVFIPPPPTAIPAPDTTQLFWNEGIPGATFTLIDSLARLKTGRFCWTPPVGSASTLPYTFTARVEDNACPLKGEASRMFRVRVKKRANSAVNISKISNGVYAIQSAIDSSTFKGTPIYQWLVRDTSGAIVSDTAIVKFNSTNSIVSASHKDTVRLKRNMLFQLEHSVNNAPYNCPSVNADTVTVDSVLQTLIKSSRDTLLCAGTSVVLSTTTHFANGDAHYQWFKNYTALIGDTSESLSLINIPRLEDAVYSVRVTDSTGNTNTDKVRIRSKDNTANSFLDTYTNCLGDSTQVMIGSAYSDILWSDGSTDAIRLLTQSSNPWVSYSDSFLCHYSDTLDVTFFLLPETLLEDSTTCAGSLTISPGIFTSYVWNIGITSQSITVNNSGQYDVLVTDSNGCQSRDTAYILLWNAQEVDLGNDTSQCAGTIVLTNNTAGSQLWSTGSTSASITADTTGEYSIVTTDINGCQSRDTILVDIYSTPTQNWADTIAYCSDLAVILASKPFAIYQWSSGEMSQEILVDSSQKFTLYFEDLQGCSSTDSVYIEINSVPVLSLGNDTAFCENTLTLDAGNYPTKSWNTGSSSQTINVNTSGTYIASIIDVNSCSASDTIDIEVFANPELSLGNDTAFCGDSLLLTIASGNNYTWSTGDTLSYTTINTSGDYWISITDSNGCSASDTVNVTFNSNTSIPALTRVGDSIESNLTGTHYWFLDDIPTADANTTNIGINARIGNFTAIHQDTNGCISDTSNSITRTAGIGKISSSPLKVYPNPTNGKVTIDAAGLGKVQSIKLYDSQGKLVENVQTVNSSLIDLEWETRSGMLWIVLTADKGVYRSEVVSVR
jgi:hypothetical protein